MAELQLPTYMYNFVLRFYGPVKPMGSWRVRSVYLTTRLLGRLSPLNWQLPFLNQRERMTLENISRSISTKECWRPRRGLNPWPPGLQSDGASNWATEAGNIHVQTKKNCNRGTSLEQPTEATTFSSRYLEVQGTFWNPLRYPYLDTSDLQNGGKNKSKNHISQMNM